MCIERCTSNGHYCCVDGEWVMAVSKNFLAVVSLTMFVAGLLALHPLAPHSSEQTVETVAGQASKVQHLH